MDRDEVIKNCENLVNLSLNNALNKNSKLDGNCLNIVGYSTPEIEALIKEAGYKLHEEPIAGISTQRTKFLICGGIL